MNEYVITSENDLFEIVVNNVDCYNNKCIFHHVVDGTDCSSEYTFINFSIKMEYKNVIEFLLEYLKTLGDEEYKKQIHTSIVFAIGNSSTEIVLIFLNCDVNINTKDQNGLNYFDLAIRRQKNDLAKILIERKINLMSLNNEGITCLAQVIISYIDDDDMIYFVTKILDSVKQKMKSVSKYVNHFGENGSSALHCACRNKNISIEIIDILIELKIADYF